MISFVVGAIAVSKDKITRRQKDISRLIREKRQVYKSRLKALKK